MLKGKVILDTTCRLCLSESRRYVRNIFDKNCPKAVSMEERLQQVLQLKLTRDPNLPIAICLKCRNRIEEWSQYKNFVLANQESIEQSFAVNGEESKIPTDRVIKQEHQDTEGHPEATELVIASVTSVAGENGVYANTDAFGYMDYPENFVCLSQEFEADPLEGRGIEFVAAEDSSGYMNLSEDDNMTDPFSDADNRRQSSRNTNKNLKYFLNRREAKSFQKAVQEQLRLERKTKKLRRSATHDEDLPEESDNTMRHCEGMNLTIEAKHHDHSGHSKSDADQIVEASQSDAGTEPPQKRLRIERAERKRQRDLLWMKERETFDLFKLDYDQWSLKVDTAIRNFTPNLTCQLCNVPQASFNSLRIHMINVHENEGFLCCGRPFSTRAEFYSHILYHQYANPLASCETCLITLDTSSELMLHNQEHHSKPTFKCEGCPMEFCTKFQMIRHYYKVHLPSKWTSCHLCPGIRLLYSELHQHYSVNHKSPPRYECKVCQHFLPSHYKIMDHETTAHGLHIQNFICLHCGKFFNNLRGFKHHFNAQTWNPKSCKFVDCPKCDLIFPRLEELDEHVKNIHKPNGELFLIPEKTENQLEF